MTSTREGLASVPVGRFHVACVDADKLLESLDDASVRSIITSPPYDGLPGRGATREALAILAARAPRVLAANGTMTLIVGSTEKAPMLPFTVAHYVSDTALANGYELAPVAWYAWKRPDAMKRDIGHHHIVADIILHFAIPGYEPPPLHIENVLQTSMVGFDYGIGITTPPDIAAYLVQRSTSEADLIVDPFAGLGEIGVQAVHQKRRFAGCDIDAGCVDIANARIANAVPKEA